MCTQSSAIFKKEKCLIYQFQSGFRRKYSTESCFLYFADFNKTDIPHGNLVGILLLDVHKAFDSILCDTLYAMGIDPILQVEYKR